jgi:translation initiation factor 2B subunit (eIF-2B alpha/beta/delta family)
MSVDLSILDIRIQEVLSDKSSGSTGILEKIMAILNSFLADQNVDPDMIISRYLNISISLENSFAVVHHFHNYLRSHMKQQLKSSELANKIENYRETWRNSEEKLIKNALRITKIEDQVVLLHSKSETLINLFREISRSKKLEIIQTESRPGLEGRKQALELVKQGHKVKVITDGSVGNHLNEFHLCLVGADAIYEDRFINKTGTLSIALISNYGGKLFYVLADRRKNIKDNWIFKEDPKPNKEVWEQGNPGISIENLYFESIPNTLVTQFIFD